MQIRSVFVGMVLVLTLLLAGCTEKIESLTKSEPTVIYNCKDYYCKYVIEGPAHGTIEFKCKAKIDPLLGNEEKIETINNSVVVSLDRGEKKEGWFGVTFITVKEWLGCNWTYTPQ